MQERKNPNQCVETCSSSEFQLSRHPTMAWEEEKLAWIFRQINSNKANEPFRQQSPSVEQEVPRDDPPKDENNLPISFEVFRVFKDGDHPNFAEVFRHADFKFVNLSSSKVVRFVVQLDFLRVLIRSVQLHIDIRSSSTSTVSVKEREKKKKKG